MIGGRASLDLDLRCQKKRVVTLEGKVVLKSEQKCQGLNIISITAPASSFRFTISAGFPELQMKSLVFIQT